MVDRINNIINSYIDYIPVSNIKKVRSIINAFEKEYLCTMHNIDTREAMLTINCIKSEFIDDILERSMTLNLDSSILDNKLSEAIKLLKLF